MPSITLLFCLYVLTYEFQLNLNPSPNNSDPSINLISYNVRNFSHKQERVIEIGRSLKAYQPDIVCLQEFRNQHMNGGQRAIRYLQKELDLPHVAFVKHPYHIHGVIFFSKYPIVKIDTLFHLAHSVNSGFAAYMDMGEQDTILIGNIHLHSFQFPSWNWIKRDLWNRVPDVIRKCSNILKEQDRTLKQSSDFLASYKYPIIITGDMNAMPHTRILSYLYEKFDDTFLNVGKGVGWTYPYLKKYDVGIRIDYQFYSTHWNVNQHRVIDIHYSDHLPIFTSYTRE